MKYIFLRKQKFEEPIRILFLCGSRYSESEDDKRNVLKAYLEQDSANKVIILEKYFNFNRILKKDFLSYYDFELNNLYYIEMLASLVANKIIILHESYSTAGEIGVFASNERLRKKIITLIPNRYSIEEEKFSSFLKLAFWKREERLVNNNVIQYFPIVEKVYVSEDRNIYHTYFHENKIPKTVGEKLKNQIGEKDKNDMHMEFCQKGEGDFDVYMEFGTLKNYVMALLSITEFRQKLYNCKKHTELKDLFKTTFEKNVRDTMKEEINVYPNKLNFIISGQSEFNLSKCINLIVLILHACSILNIVREDEDDSISVHLVKNAMRIIGNYNKLIRRIEPIEWGE